jgi:radical SAM protein with 4Fe4S-binding SPASM domain
MAVRLFNQYFSLREVWKLRSSLIKPPLRVGKMYNFLLNYLSQKFRRTRAWGYPPFIMVEPTSRCNMDCPMCFVRDLKDKYQPGDLTLSNFNKIIADLGPATITLALWGYGEPLLNKHIAEMIAIAKRYGIFTSVSSNCYSLSKDKAEALIDSGLDYLIASVDGASEETYARYRSPGKFQRVIDNMRYMCRRKKELGKSNPFVEWQFIVMKGNEHEIGKARDLALSIGVDKFSLKKAWIMEWDNPADYLPSHPKYHLQIYKGKLDDNPCSRPWNAPMITWKGDVMVCCADFSYGHRMGNMFEEGTFAKIWNNDKFRFFRKQVSRNINSIDICRKCAAKNFKDGFLPLE